MTLIFWQELFLALAIKSKQCYIINGKEQIYMHVSN